MKNYSSVKKRKTEPPKSKKIIGSETWFAFQTKNNFCITQKCVNFIVPYLNLKNMNHETNRYTARFAALCLF